MIAAVVVGCAWGCGGPSAGPGLPGLDGLTAEELVRAFRELHARVYSVYDLPPDRDLVHDLLSSSFAGRQLTEEYIEHYTTLFTMEAEKTAIDVLRVDYEDVRVTEREAVRTVSGPRERAWIDADWSVGGVVTHQGHKHVRVNRYRALFAVAPTPDGLRIVETRIRNSERVRSVFSGDGWPGAGDATSAGGMMSLEELIEAGVGLPEDVAPDGTDAGGEDSDR